MIAGTIDEWVEFAPNRWHRVVNGEVSLLDGVHTLREGYSFAELWERRNNPSPEPVFLSYAKFRSRWKTEELEKLHSLAKEHWQVEDYIGLARADGVVNLSGAAAKAAKKLFVQLGALTQERADEIFVT